MARVKRAEEGSGPRSQRWPGLSVFALLVTLAPLAFGAVDRISQIVLLVLLGVGILVHPLATTRLSRGANVALLALLGILVVKEFAPAAWFGATAWRTALTQSYGLSFPWTHHPEPSRALDALLAGGAAVVWFIWVRTLAADRESRVALAWILFGAAALVAVVSFATQSGSSKAIYGFRYTAGWSGFGPFPNRNHTACFLAMGALLGAGCLTWAAARRNFRALAAGLPLLGLVLAALVATKSRGGLVGFGCGLTVFLALVLVKVRDRRAWAGVAAAALVIGALALTFGGSLLARFSAAEAVPGAHLGRLSIWRDTLGMWRDAPLFGHGLGSFPQLFPWYVTFDLENHSVLHPESSWLQWLAELGAIPVLIGAVGFALFFAKHLRQAMSGRRSFYLRAAAAAAVAALLCHGLIDVPAHRWGTAAFALAALALACPLAPREPALHATRKPALVVAAMALFWSLPLLTGGPAWAPLALTRLLTAEATNGSVRLPQLEESLRYFPLSPALRQAVGERQLFGRERASGEWSRHFQIALRLTPGSWETAAEMARASRRASPGQALHYWQIAIERAGRRRGEFLALAMLETAGNPSAEATWAAYVEARPELLLDYAQAVAEPQARTAFERWWRERALGAAALSEDEVRLFHELAPRFASAGQLDAWVKRHASRKAEFFKTWAALFHAWGNDTRAWETLASVVSAPAFPTPRPGANRADLESRWHADPTDVVNARAWAGQLASEGAAEASRRVVLNVAAQPEAPAWFVEKAAHLLAESGRIGEAVELLLRGGGGE